MTAQDTRDNHSQSLENAFYRLVRLTWVSLGSLVIQASEMMRVGIQKYYNAVNHDEYNYWGVEAKQEELC